MNCEVPQWLKPLSEAQNMARLKSCPFKASYALRGESRLTAALCQA